MKGLPAPCGLPPLPWFLVQIKPNSFQIARRNLERQKLSVFSPQQAETRRTAGHFKTTLRHLFPGYLFTSFDPESGPWRTINHTYGVSRMVSFGTQAPRPVPSGIMSALFARCDDADLVQPPTALIAGDQVQVTAGPFADFVTTVEGVSPDRRIWVLLDILGRATKVALIAEDLKRL